MKLFLALALCSLAVLAGNGCTTHPQPKPAAAAVPTAVPPAKATYLTGNQEAQLRSRLDKLTVGMGRDKVLETLNLDSFGVPVYANANDFGITYIIPKKHSLVILFNEGDFADTLAWAKFDNDVWPRNNRLRKVPAK